MRPGMATMVGPKVSWPGYSKNEEPQSQEDIAVSRSDLRSQLADCYPLFPSVFSPEPGCLPGDGSGLYVCAYVHGSGCPKSHLQRTGQRAAGHLLQAQPL